jgi:phospholipase C
MSPPNTPELSLSLRENTVTIIDEAGRIQSIAYVPNSLVITDGQPSETPPAIEVSGNTYTITLQAGRKGSEAVAESFNAAAGGDGKEYAPDGGDGGTPDELNFYFAVTINFGQGSATAYLGQGHFAATNNWWIGGSPIYTGADTPRFEYTAGNFIYTIALSGDHETFVFERVVDTRPVSPITNVFVLMLENRSFDHMLALSGIPGIIAATTSDSNAYNGTVYNFRGDAPGSMPTDPGHEFTDVVEQLAGQGASYSPYGPYPPIDNSGFAANYAVTTTEGSPPPAADVGDIMAGFDTQSQLPALYQLATNFVLCDQWFSSLPGPTWPNRFFLHGASSDGLDHSPTTPEMVEWESVDGFRYPNGSIFDAMNAAEITYRLYHDTNGPIEGAVSQVSAIHGIELWDVHPLSDLANDIQQNYPYQYTFIEPNYGDVAGGTYENGTSQHPMDGVAGGESLISWVYETIRNSPIWESSLLIITYDEHGGFYDHFAPGPAQPPDDGSQGSKWNTYGFNFSQYGVRVPAVVVSPWTGAGVVDHTVYDHASVLATLEWLYGLSPLTDRDGAAASLHGLISTTLRKDTPMALDRPASRPPQKPPLTPEERAARDLEPVPEGSLLKGFLGVLLKADSKLSANPAERAAAVARFRSVRTRGDARAYIREVMAKVEAVRAAQRKDPRT